MLYLFTGNVLRFNLVLLGLLSLVACGDVGDAGTNSDLPTDGGTNDVVVENSAPTVSSVKITDDNAGSVIVGDNLTSSYVYADAESDAEFVSTFRWLRDGKAISGATSSSYILVAADSGTNITFEVTPIAQAGTILGNAVISNTLFVTNSAPVALSVGITDDNGDVPRVGDALTGTYNFVDIDNDAEGSSLFRWLRDGVAIIGETDTTYTLIALDNGAEITFEVTPIAATGVAAGVTQVSGPIVVDNSAPIATALSIDDDNGGVIVVGTTLTARYTYSDIDADAEGISTFRWFRDGAAIDGATADTYKLLAADSGKTITFEVTPAASAGTTPGVAVTSTGLLVVNSAPVADAGLDQSVALGALVSLDGSGSSDADSDTLSYLWSFTADPSGGSVAISDTTSENPTFTASAAGTYTLQLIVNDGTVDSAPVTVSISTINNVPIADAGLDQSVALDALVTLDGSGSSDADSDTLSYLWSFTADPSGGSVTISDTAAENPTFTASVAGTYTLQLIVNDGTVDSAPVTVSISTINNVPIADAGVDQSVALGALVSLDGSGSSDADSDTLSYLWSFTVDPSGGSVTISDTTAENPTFTASVAGTYTLQLVVNDGTVDSAPVTVSISTINNVPIADAGVDQSVALGALVTLDGSGSSDADSDTLSYLWSFTVDPSEGSVTISDTAAENPTFTASAAGTYTLQLIVNDGTADSVTAIVNISTINVAPTVSGVTIIGGTAGTAVEGDVLTGEYSYFDADGDLEGATRFRWLRGGLAIADATAKTYTVVALDSGENISFEVTPVTDLGVSGTAVESIAVVVDSSNVAPVANLVGTTDDNGGSIVVGVTLTGTYSYFDTEDDVEGISTFRWLRNTAEIPGATEISYILIAADSGEAITFEVTPVAQTGEPTGIPAVSAERLVTNSAPVANAGDDQSVALAALVLLDGSASTDIDGDTLTHTWTLKTKPATSSTVLLDPTTANPSFTVDAAGTYEVELIVNDGTVDSAPVIVTVSTINSAPVADAGLDQSVALGALVTLDGSGSSDADSDTLSYLWSFTADPSAGTTALSDITAEKPTFTASVAGTYTLQLIVNDGTADSAPANVTISTINSAPVADAGADQSVVLGALVTLDGSASSDADSDTLTYLWSFTADPSGGSVTISDTTAENPTFTASVAGTYTVQLIVNDGTVDSAPVTVSISTINNVPIADAGPDQTVTSGDLVLLDGSASSDADSDTLTYLWSFTSDPSAGADNLDDVTLQNPSFTTSASGTYVLQLIVNDGKVDSVAATVTITAEP